MRYAIRWFKCKLKPPKNPWTHPWVGMSLQMINLQIMSKFIKLLVISPDPPIDPLTHPTTHTPTHRWGVSTNHKSSIRIELSQLHQDLFNR